MGALTATTPPGAAGATILSGIDFNAPGKQLGFGRLVHSDNDHDASVIPVPVAVIGSGSGTTVLLVAGTHGDEYEGQVLLHELIRSVRPGDVNGRLIIVPSANAPAVSAGTRVSPIDHGNLNRSYPGAPDRGPTAQAAHLLCRELVPRADFVIDLHSGGSNSTYVPCLFLYRGPTEALWAQKVKAATVFNMPYTMVVPPRLEPGSLSTAGDDAGVVTLSTELGGGGTINREVLLRARTGLAAFLDNVGVLPKPASGVKTDVGGMATTWIELVPDSAVSSTVHGLFEPTVDLGQPVRAGDVVAKVHFLDELDRESRTFRAAVDGIVAIIRRPTLVRPGSHLVHIAPVRPAP